MRRRKVRKNVPTQYKYQHVIKFIINIIIAIFGFYDAIWCGVILITRFGHAGTHGQFFHFAFLGRITWGSYTR